ncbi:hypothetical protein J6590_050466 [Homalodisca vitripennis]|nr:hypothetical protein J6590_050466 [Homalodisca vitripennis]
MILTQNCQCRHRAGDTVCISRVVAGYKETEACGVVLNLSRERQPYLNPDKVTFNAPVGAKSLFQQRRGLSHKCSFLSHTATVYELILCPDKAVQDTL